MSHSQLIRFAIALAFTMVETGPALACASLLHAASGPGGSVILQTQAANEGLNSAGIPGKPKELVMAAGDVDPMKQLAGEWIVTNIDTTEIASGLGVTLEFDGFRLRGKAPCNTYQAAVKFGDIGIEFLTIEAGEKACDSTTMATETAFFKALESVDRYEMGDGDILTFYGSDIAVLQARH